jgi:hypothetical protein
MLEELDGGWPTLFLDKRAEMKGMATGNLRVEIWGICEAKEK